MKWILRYSIETSDVCLEFGRSDDSLVGFVDSDLQAIWTHEDHLLDICSHLVVVTLKLFVYCCSIQP